MTRPDFDVHKEYLACLENDKEITMPVAAIQSLVALVAQVQPSTSAELVQVLQTASETLKSGYQNAIPLSAGCDLFLRFVLRNINEYKDWDACRRNLVENGRLFAQRARESRQRIAEFGKPFIRDNNVVLVHGCSRAVNSLLESAALSHTRFSVYVTEAQVSNEGSQTAEQLRSAGIPVCIIPDCAVGFVINKVDLVFLGAEGVAESGGVINQIGSCQVAMLAHTSKKPVYIIAESHKFVRMYPLSSSEIPQENSFEFSSRQAPFEIERSPRLDFTPHTYITALVTDFGVLTPAAVSEELIKIWL